MLLCYGKLHAEQQLTPHHTHWVQEETALVLLFVQKLGMRGERSWYASAVSHLRPGRDCVVRP